MVGALVTAGAGALVGGLMTVDAGALVAGLMTAGAGELVGPLMTAGAGGLVFAAGASAPTATSTGKARTKPNPAATSLGMAFMVPENAQGRSATAKRHWGGG